MRGKGLVTFCPHIYMDASDFSMLDQVSHHCDFRASHGSLHPAGMVPFLDKVLLFCFLRYLSVKISSVSLLHSFCLCLARSCLLECLFKYRPVVECQQSLRPRRADCIEIRDAS